MIRGSLPGNKLGQVVHILVCLCHQAVVPVAWQWWATTGKVTVGRELHRPCVTDFSGLSYYPSTNLKPKWRRLEGCLFMLFVGHDAFYTDRR